MFAYSQVVEGFTGRVKRPVDRARRVRGVDDAGAGQTQVTLQRCVIRRDPRCRVALEHRQYLRRHRVRVIQIGHAQRAARAQSHIGLSERHRCRISTTHRDHRCIVRPGDRDHHILRHHPPMPVVNRHGIGRRDRLPGCEEVKRRVRGAEVPGLRAAANARAVGLSAQCKRIGQRCLLTSGKRAARPDVARARHRIAVRVTQVNIGKGDRAAGCAQRRRAQGCCQLRDGACGCGRPSCNGRSVIGLDHAHRRGDQQRCALNAAVAGATAVFHLGEGEHAVAGCGVVKLGVLVGDAGDKGVDIGGNHTTRLAQCNRRRSGIQGHHITHAVGRGATRAVGAQGDGLAIEHDRFVGPVLQAADREGQTGYGLSGLDRISCRTAEDADSRCLCGVADSLGKGRTERRCRQCRCVIHRRHQDRGRHGQTRQQAVVNHPRDRSRCARVITA